MRVGFFTDTFRPSRNGVVVSMESFATELAQLGCEVVVFAPRNPRLQPDLSHPLPDISSYSGSTPGIEYVHWVPSLRSVFGPQHRVAVPLIRQLQRTARRHQLDLVHSQTPFQIGYAGVQVARALGLPLVHTYHTFFAEYVHYLKAGARLGKLAVPRYSRWICNLHDLILTPSNDIRAVLRQYGVRKPIEVLPTGVHLSPAPIPAESHAARRQLGLPDSARLLLYVGRLAREKNIDLLLDSLRRLRALQPDFLLVLVGDGPDLDRLQSRVHQLGLSRQVLFAGWIPHEQLRPWFVAADLFVFPSASEAQGLSLLEAMAHARPVVATQGPGVRDVIRSGVSGLLVEPTPERFADAIHSLLNDPARSSKLACGARAAADHLDTRRQARLLAQQYLALVHGGERAARCGWRGLARRAWEETVAWR